MRGFLTGVVFLAVGIFWVTDVSAQVCSVPTLVYPSVQAAPVSSDVP